MKFVTPPLEINDSDGFKNDVLQREKFGEALANLIAKSSDDNGLVISLNSKWREGKTTFIKMWQGLLTSKNIPSIYIDAFENDYTDDAFISIVNAITLYAEQNSKEKKVDPDFIDKAKKVGVHLLSLAAKIATKTAIKVITLNTINEETLSKLRDDIADATSETAEKLVSEALNNYKVKADIFQSFKTSLSGLPASLEDNTSGKLVIIIDELDRCRPSFAVEVLEKIKHLFAVKNIVFVLAMHKQQLEEAIKHVYGSNIDAHTYLQKFINIETSLPEEVNGRISNKIDLYIKKLSELHNFEIRNRDSISTLIALAQHFNLSLRQLEKIFTNLMIR